MTDIVERAKAALAIEFSRGHPWPAITGILRELIDELASTRSQRNEATKNCYRLAAELAELTAPPKIHDIDFGDEAVT